MFTTNALVEYSPSSVTEGDVASAPRPTLDINRLFQQHQRHLLRFVRRYVRTDEDAEDVVQNTFMEAIRCADQFSGLSKPSTWLFGIALNLARNQVRKNCSDMYETVDEAFIDQIVDDHADPATLTELRQTVRRVETLLANLPPKIRLTFEAVMEEESTYEKAAAQLRVPIGTVRSRVSRVRATVREQLG